MTEGSLRLIRFIIDNPSQPSLGADLNFNHSNADGSSRFPIAQENRYLWIFYANFPILS